MDSRKRIGSDDKLYDAPGDLLESDSSVTSEVESLSNKVSGRMGKKTKVHYKQAFNDVWLTDPNFKDWIQRDPSDKFAVVCKVCSSKLVNVSRTALFAHNNCSKHQKNIEAKRNTIALGSFFKKTTSVDINDNVAKAELMLAAFIAEHNTPFSHSDHLVSCMKAMFPDSAIASKLASHRTKTSYVVGEGIAYHRQLDVISVCCTQPFSVIIDESTDVSISQVLAIVVRYFDAQCCKVVDALLDIIEVEDGTGIGLYTAFKNVLQEKKIPMSNIIGFASDNCSTMTGCKSGFQHHLKQDVPGIFVIGCVCHSFALCANHASNCLPSWLESFIKNICFYFSRSSKRNHNFALMQGIVQVETHKILKLSETRWLSREFVINRIIEQWDALLLYFQSESTQDKVDGAGQIYQTMNAAGTKHMLLFLSYILRKVNAMNIEFQTEHFRIHRLYDSISDEYRSILGMFVKDDIINSKQLFEIDPLDERQYKKLNSIDAGGRCAAQLVKEPLGAKEDLFRSDILNYLKELCKQISNRFIFSDESVIAKLRLLDPSGITSTARDKDRPSIISLAVHFPSLVKDSELDELEEQWRSLHFAKNSVAHLAGSEPPEFWHNLNHVKDGNGQVKFGLLTKFMCSLMALPHSSACVERIFSQVNLVKTKQTNRLKCETVARRIMAKEAIKLQGSKCYDWKPSKLLVEDVKVGCCSKRYKERLLKFKQENAIEYAELSDDNEDTD